MIAAIQSNNLVDAQQYVKEAIQLLRETDIDEQDDSGFKIADGIDYTGRAIWALEELEETSD